LLIDSRVVERRANTVGISLRSGCHCNPGAGEVALGFSRKEMAGPFAYRDRLSYEEFLRVIDGKKTGRARVGRAGEHLRRRAPLRGVRRDVPRRPVAGRADVRSGRNLRARPGDLG